MHNTRPMLSKAEIIESVLPERRQQYAELQIRFGRAALSQEVNTTQKTLVFSGSPDFIAENNEDGTLKVKKVWLARRHVLIDEEISYVDIPNVTYGPILGDETEDKNVLFFKSDNPEKDLIFGLFEDRLPEQVITRLKA